MLRPYGCAAFFTLQNLVSLLQYIPLCSGLLHTQFAKMLNKTFRVEQLASEIAGVFFSGVPSPQPLPLWPDALLT